MAYDLIFIPIILSLLTLLVFTLAEVVSSTCAWDEFRRLTRGLPMLGERNIICNHTLSWCLRKDVCNEILRYFQKSPHKTVGWLMDNQFAATTIDLDLMRRIVLDKPDENINKAQIQAPLANYLEDSIVSAQDRRWRRLRAALEPALKPSRFKSPNVMSEVDKSIGKLIEAIDSRLALTLNGNRDGVTIQAGDLLHRYSLDQVFSSFFKQPHLIDFKAAECRWTRRVKEASAAVQNEPVIRFSTMLPSLRVFVDWLTWNYRKQGEWRQEILRLVQLHSAKAIEARRELDRLKASDKKADENEFPLRDGSRFTRNMIDYFTDHFLNGTLSREEYFQTASFLVGAADTSVSEVLVTTLYELSLNQGVQDKLREAIKRQGGAECEYLGWVIDESLRLLPPVPVSCSRMLSKDIKIHNGYRLPAGTFVMFPNYVVHRMEQYWGPDASSFRPERFAEKDKFHPMQFVPFGAGARICPGKEFALFQMRQVLAKLLVRYKFECRPKEDAYKFDAPFLAVLIRNTPAYINVKLICSDPVDDDAQG